jgi:hypothetical protein
MILKVKLQFYQILNYIFKKKKSKYTLLKHFYKPSSLRLERISIRNGT